MPEAWQILHRKNVHPRDKCIVFDEPSHTYTVNGTHAGYISVTKLLHCFFPHFDPVKIIRKMRSGANWKSSKYYGRTDQEIMNEWNENGRQASEAGTKMHLSIEQFLNDAEYLIPAEVKVTPEWRYFQKFWSDFGDDLEPYRMEWEVWVEEIKLAGSIDGVFRRKSDGKFLIYDWKRSKEIKSDNPFSSGLPPVDHLPDTNYWHYTLQLNVYRWILETHYKLDIAEMYIVILHPDNKSYRRMRLNRLDDEIEDMIDARLRAVKEGSTAPVIIPLPEEDELQNDKTDYSKSLFNI
jgi:ATP-dependent exoDNAse (exonuclease V) beta subunit